VARCSLIHSRSGAALLEKAGEFLTRAQDREVLVLAPTRAAANELTIRESEQGRLGVHAFTITQLAAHLAARQMAERAIAPISRLGIDAISARIAHVAQREKRLPYFTPVAQMPGFPRALAHTIAELRLEQVPAHELASTGKAGADLAHLIGLYERELEERALADLPLVLRFAAEEAAKDLHRFAGLPILLLDLTIDSQSHAALLSALAANSPDVLAAIITGGEEFVAKTLDVPAQALDRTAADSTLDRVRYWLFSTEQPPIAEPDANLLFSAPGESLECVEMARRIRKLAEQGTPFDRVAILLRNVEQYQPLLEEALRRASIPAWFSRGTARPDPAGRAFLALLACAADGCSASRFAEYLSLDQLPPVDRSGAPVKRPRQWSPPDDEMLADFAAPPAATEPPPDPDGFEPALAVPIGWEKLLVDAAVIGGHDRWARRLRGLRAELQTQLRDLDKEDESHRPHVERRIEQLRRLEHFALPLIDLLGSLPASANWGAWLDALEELAQTALRNPATVLSVLSELHPMSEVGPATLNEVYDVLAGKLSVLRADPPRRRFGHVFIGSIDEARGRTFDTVFLPGLAEGLFPRRSLEDPLLLDESRAKFPQLETQDQRVARERMLLRSAAASATNGFVVSYPRMDIAQARQRVPSFYALEVLRAAEGRLPSLREFEKRAARSAPSRLDWPAPTDPSIAVDNAEYDLAALHAAVRLRGAEAKGSARYLMEENRFLAQSLRTRSRRWRNRWFAADGLVDPDAKALDALKPHRFSARSYSPSSLQHFASCPYRFLLQAIFQLRPREAAVPLEQMDPLTRGALFHAVQFQLFRQLQEKKLLPITPVRRATIYDIADSVLDRVAAEYEDDLAPAIARVWKTEVEDVRTDLRGWIRNVAESEPDWVPFHFEFAFGLAREENRDPESVQGEARILNGVRLRGSIDLVERHATRNALRVTDHKTGKAPQNRPQYVGGGAILQPLLFALAAEQLLGQQVESGSLFYCTQRGEFSQFSIPLDAAARDRIARVVETIGQSIESGFLPAAPQAGACGYCDYRPVCGPYEELRSKRKPADRLEPLINIRNMP